MKNNPYAVLREDFPKLDLFKKAHAIFGRDYQMGIVVEECSELQKELLKNTNRKKENIPEIIDETADVFIGLLHVVISYDINESVAKRVSEKLERLEGRIKEREASADLAEYTRRIEAKQKELGKGCK